MHEFVNHGCFTRNQRGHATWILAIFPGVDVVHVFEKDRTKVYDMICVSMLESAHIFRFILHTPVVTERVHVMGNLAGSIKKQKIC